MPPRTLPPEIQDRVIDEFAIPDTDGPPDCWTEEERDDLQVLRTLLLVSRDVATRARHHLFESINISFIPDKDWRNANVQHIDTTQLLLLADIIDSSASSKDLGILPHIRRVYLFCLMPKPYDDDDDDWEEELLRHGGANGRQEALDSETPNQYWPLLCKILDTIQRKARRIDEFSISSNDPKGFGTGPCYFDAKMYCDWDGLPKEVQEAIINFLHSPRLLPSLNSLKVREFINVPVDLLVGTDAEFLTLHCTPAPTLGLLENTTGESEDSILPPSLWWVDTIDYILPQVASLCLGTDKNRSSSQSTVTRLDLTIPCEHLKIPFDADRFAEVGRTITNFFPSLDLLRLEIDTICPRTLEKTGIIGMPSMPIDIYEHKELEYLVIHHKYRNHDWISESKPRFTRSWYSASGDPSGPPICNLISILNHCPPTLKEIIWVMGFNVLEVVGADFKREMVDGYGELDQLLISRFPSLEKFTIYLSFCDNHVRTDFGQADYYSQEGLEERCMDRLKKAMSGLGDRLHLMTECM